MVTGGVRLHVRRWDGAGSDAASAVPAGPRARVERPALGRRSRVAGRRGAPGGRRRPARPRPLGQARRRLRPPHLRRRPRAGDRPPRLGAAGGRRPVVGRQRRAAAGPPTGPSSCTRWPSSTVAGSACATRSRTGRTALASSGPPDLRGTPSTRLAAAVRLAHPGWPATGVEATMANFEVLEDGTVRPWLSLDHHLAVLARPLGTRSRGALPRRGRARAAPPGRPRRGRAGHGGEAPSRGRGPRACCPTRGCTGSGRRPTTTSTPPSRPRWRRCCCGLAA